VVTLLPLAMVVFVREPARRPEQSFQWAGFRALGRRHVLALALLGALYSLIINGANEIVNPFLTHEYGIDLIAAGFYTSVWGAGVVVGGLTGGRLIDRIGHRRAMLGAIIVALVAIMALSLVVSPVLAWPLVFVFGLAFGYYETAYFATSMEFTDPRIAASMFAILMACANIGVGLGLFAGGSMVDAIGYRLTFVIIAALNLLALPLIPIIFRRNRQEAE
jgi:PAT family beta-lactamase induction signal transducer AmpG